MLSLRFSLAAVIVAAPIMGVSISGGSPTPAEGQQGETLTSFCSDSKNPDRCIRMEVEDMNAQCASVRQAAARVTCLKNEAEKRGLRWPLVMP